MRPRLPVQPQTGAPDPIHSRNPSVTGPEEAGDFGRSFADLAGRATWINTAQTARHSNGGRRARTTNGSPAQLCCASRDRRSFPPRAAGPARVSTSAPNEVLRTAICRHSRASIEQAAAACARSRRGAADADGIHGRKDADLPFFVSAKQAKASGWGTSTLTWHHYSVDNLSFSFDRPKQTLYSSPPQVKGKTDNASG